MTISSLGSLADLALLFASVGQQTLNRLGDSSMVPNRIEQYNQDGELVEFEGSDRHQCRECKVAQ